MFLSDLTKKEDGILKLSDVLVAMIAVCGRLNMILTKSISSLVELVPVILQELTAELPAIPNLGGNNGRLAMRLTLVLYQT